MSEVEQLKNRVSKLYHEGNFNKHYKAVTWIHGLEYIFKSNRFITYYYDDDEQTSGYYMNRTNDDDIRSDRREKIEFDNYEAYKIARAVLPADEKFAALNKMFDSFLN